VSVFDWPEEERTPHPAPSDAAPPLGVEQGCVNCDESICRDCDPCADPDAGFWKEPFAARLDAPAEVGGLVGQHIGWLKLRADRLDDRAGPGDALNAEHARDVATTLERLSRQVEGAEAALVEARTLDRGFYDWMIERDLLARGDEVEWPDIVVALTEHEVECLAALSRTVEVLREKASAIAKLAGDGRRTANLPAIERLAAEMLALSAQKDTD